MILFKILLSVLLPYLLGGFSAAILLSRLLYGRDVRSCGSGNAGATNMARSFGLKMGVITLLCDAAKAVISVLIGKALLGGWGISIAGMACLLGHCFPALHGFRGGKGVSVCAALTWVIDWRVGAAALAVFASTAMLSRKVSLSSISASIVLSAVTLALSLETPKIILALFCTVTVILRHKENIVRLINGTEPDFKSK